MKEGVSAWKYYFLGVPVVSGNIVYSFTSTTLFAVEDLGDDASLKWAYPLPGRPEFAVSRHLSNLILHKKILYVGLSTGIYAVNADTGKMLWVLPTEHEQSPSMSTPPAST